MKINIFGVGRSGTTGLQLYLSYMIAKREGKVWINSEPYIWQSRKGPLSYYGQKVFLQSGIILDESESFKTSHYNYIKSLNYGRSNIVNKFIHANGLVNQITNILKPDLTFFIYRDILEILQSIKKYKWEYTSVYNSYLSQPLNSFWKKFVTNKHTVEILSQFNFNLDLIEKSEELRNTLYWYVNNMVSLNCNIPNSYYIDYSNLDHVEKILKNYFDDVLPINNALFFGDQLNKEFPLKDNQRASYILKALFTRIDKMQFYLWRRFKINLPLIMRRSGSEVSVSKNAQLSSKPHIPTSKIDMRDDIHPITEVLRADFYRRFDELQRKVSGS